jgi:hypothetical protein
MKRLMFDSEKETNDPDINTTGLTKEGMMIFTQKLSKN